MKYVKIFLIINIFLLVFQIGGCTNKNKIVNILEEYNVMFEYGFAGSSFDIYKQKNILLVRRYIFGSGIPIIGTISYRIDKIKDNLILFHEVYQIDNNLKNPDFVQNKNFIIQFGKNNKIELIVNNKIYLETARTKK